MASGKRASMREGPLAALFRKTEEAAQDAEAAGQAAESGAREPRASRSGPLTTARREEPAAESPPGADEPRAGESLPAAAGQRAETPRARADGSQAGDREAAASAPPPSTAAAQRARPHPSLHDVSPPEEEPERRVPSPQERLRHAFSADIPENILERAPARRAAAAEPDPYATSRGLDEPAAWDRPRPAGHPVLRVVGVGGAGVNAVNRMVEAEVHGVEFVAINTDLQSLQQSVADATLHIGPRLTRGLGAGSNPDLGRQAAMEEYDRIKSTLKGSDMVFIAAGAGGGTGTGAAPIVARIAREIGALTVGIVTRPFGFEGKRRDDAANAGINALAEEVDTLIVVPNNRLLTVLDKSTSMVEAFRVADDVLRQGVQGVSDLVTLPGLINLDFADVRTIMSEAGNALLGIGMGVGEHRATVAAEQAVSSPLLETSMEGARKILLSITGGESLSLWEVNEAAKAVSAAAHPEANIIFGAMVDEKLDDQVWVTVVATGYAESKRPRPVTSALQEPAGEPRVQRRTPAARPERRRGGLGVSELDVPEFLPRG
jgi:cell division protein FtsZ